MSAARIRNYDAVAAAMRCAGSRERRMQMVVDALWDAFRLEGFSWAGFYLDQPDEPDERRLVLGPRRDKPACSPIGLHGVCGQALRSRRTRIIHDVRELGRNYIACDPRDRSEIVIPLCEPRPAHPVETGDVPLRAWGVLDVDSHDVGAFTEHDDLGLRRVLAAAGLLPAPPDQKPSRRERA